MKLYYLAGDWQLPGSQDRHAIRVEIPSSPAELRAWLSARNVPAEPGQATPALFDEPEPVILAPKPQPVPAAAPCRTASDIEDFILNGASVAEVERIFAALGARFAEHSKVARQPLPPA
jgi:hypothetical protein